VTSLNAVFALRKKYGEDKIMGAGGFAIGGMAASASKNAGIGTLSYVWDWTGTALCIFFGVWCLILIWIYIKYGEG